MPNEYWRFRLLCRPWGEAHFQLTFCLILSSHLATWRPVYEKAQIWLALNCLAVTWWNGWKLQLVPLIFLGKIKISWWWSLDRQCSSTLAKYCLQPTQNQTDDIALHNHRRQADDFIPSKPGYHSSILSFQVIGQTRMTYYHLNMWRAGSVLDGRNSHNRWASQTLHKTETVACYLHHTPELDCIWSSLKTASFSLTEEIRVLSVSRKIQLTQPDDHAVQTSEEKPLALIAAGPYNEMPPWRTQVCGRKFSSWKTIHHPSEHKWMRIDDIRQDIGHDNICFTSCRQPLSTSIITYVTLSKFRG